MSPPVLLPAEPAWVKGGLGTLGASILYHLDDDEFWRRPQAYQGLKSAQLAALRFPGGELADNYDWEQHIVERAADWPGEAKTLAGRKARTDYLEFLLHAEQSGVGHVFMVINLDGAFRAAGDRSSNLERYAQKAARWVGEVKRVAGALAVHWEIGNEPYLGSSYPLTAREYAQALNVFAVAMRAVDPAVHIGAAGPGNLHGIAFADQLGAPGLARLRAGAGNSRRACPGLTVPDCIAALRKGEPAPSPQAWWPTVMAQAADSIDFAVIHRYARATPLSGTAFPLTERTLRLRAGLQRGSGRELPLALTEWNTPSEKRHRALSEIEHLIEVAIQIGNDAVAGVDYALYWPLRSPGAGHRPLLHLDGKATAVANLFALASVFAGADKIAQAVIGDGIYVLRARTPTGHGYLVVNSGARSAFVELDDGNMEDTSIQQLTSDAAGRVLPLQECTRSGLHPSPTRVHSPPRSIILIRSSRRTIPL